MRGRRLSRRTSRRVFKKGSRIHKRNLAHTASRGGVRF